MAVKLILAVMELTAAVLLIVGWLPILTANQFVITIAAAMVLKGFWFTVIEYTGKKDYQKLFEGSFDLLASLLLIIIYLGTYNSLFSLVGVFGVIKGAWYLFSGAMEL